MHTKLRVRLQLRALSMIFLYVYRIRHHLCWLILFLFSIQVKITIFENIKPVTVLELYIMSDMLIRLSVQGRILKISNARTQNINPLTLAATLLLILKIKLVILKS